MFGLFDWLKIGAGAALGAMMAFAPVYYYGKATGRQESAVAALEQSVEAYQKREAIDDKVDGADLVAICIELGGLRADCLDAVRRLEEAAAPE